MRSTLGSELFGEFYNSAILEDAGGLQNERWRNLTPHA
jgi:hypothetical protein